jgi:hypothetical protein
MPRSHFTALAAALALGAFAPRLMAQDTSSTTPTRPDTSGYTTGAGGVDTSARPGRVGATDTAGVGAIDTSSSRIKSGDSSTFTPQPGVDTSGAAGGAVTDSMVPGPSDTSGMQGRHAADSTTPGSTSSPGTGSNGSADSGGSTNSSN